MNLIDRFHAAGLWDFANNVTAEGEDDRLVLQIDDSAFTLWGRLMELSVTQSAENRLRSARGARQVCATLLKKIDTLRTRIASPHLDRAREGVCFIQRSVKDQLASLPAVSPTVRECYDRRGERSEPRCLPRGGAERDAHGVDWELYRRVDGLRGPDVGSRFVARASIGG
jgi:hypothetical protein